MAISLDQALFHFLRQGLSFKPELTDLIWLDRLTRSPGDSPVLASLLVLGYRCVPSSWLLCGAGNLNLCPQACVAIILPTKPFSKSCFVAFFETESHTVAKTGWNLLCAQAGLQVHASALASFQVLGLQI